MIPVFLKKKQKTKKQFYAVISETQKLNYYIHFSKNWKNGGDLKLLTGSEEM